MRVAVVSDIHGNRRAFEAVLADLRQVTPDLVLHGGDLAYGGTHAADIIDQVRALAWPGVRGNTDEMLWAPEGLAEFAATTPKLGPLLAIIQEMIPPTLASIGEERLRWLEGLPQQYSGEGFSLVHASPGDLWRAPMPNASDDELRSTYASLHAPIVVYGHIHRPYIRRLPGMTVANTGSVSQSYDGDTRASYLVMDGESVTIRFSRCLESKVKTQAEAEHRIVSRVRGSGAAGGRACRGHVRVNNHVPQIDADVGVIVEVVRGGSADVEHEVIVPRGAKGLKAADIRKMQDARAKLHIETSLGRGDSGTQPEEAHLRLARLGCSLAKAEEIEIAVEAEVTRQVVADVKTSTDVAADNR